MKSLGKWGVTAVFAAMAMASTLSHAALGLPPAPGPVPAVSVTASPVALVTPGVGAQAVTSLTFQFLENYDFYAISLFVDYNKEYLQFNRAASTLSLTGLGSPISLAAAAALLMPVDEGASVENDNPSNGHYSLSGFTVEPSYLVPKGAQLVLTGVFDVKGAFNTLTSPTLVAMYGSVAGLNEQTFGVSTPLQVAVTAVPEPETWMMLIGGLGLIAGSVRRRRSAIVAGRANVPG